MDDHPPKLDTDVNLSNRPDDYRNVAQVEGKTYDAKHDQRDMRRLGKRQELKVGSFMYKKASSLTDCL